MSGYKQHYLDLHPSIFIHPAFSEIWRILSDIWKSIKFIQQISFEEKASIQQIGNFFSDSLNIPRLVHIYQNIKTWMTKVMTTAKMIFCSNQDVGGKDIHLDLRIFKRPNRCKLGTANSEYKFPFWEEGVSSLFLTRWASEEGGVYSTRGLDCIAPRIGPKTMNCVEPAGRAESNKSPPSTKEMRNGRAFLEIPTPANPCAPLEARRQQPSEEAHRGGQKGGIWGQGRVGVQGGISSNF